MTATGHAVIGVVIAAKITNPLLAIPLAIASHIVADLFPHWDPGTHESEKDKLQLFAESGVDVVIGFILSYILIVYLFPTTNLAYAFMMIIAAQLLDWLWAPYAFLKIKFPLFVWAHELAVKTNVTLDKPWGIINQIAVLALLVFGAVNL